MVSVIASSVRKGNVVEKDGKLYVVIRAENIHPGKGTPVTHLEMRRISDGVKVQERYKTTDFVEKAFIDEGKYNYLYQDGDDYIFMEPNTFEQVHVRNTIIGDAAAYLQENMEVTHEPAQRRADRGRAAGRAWCSRSSTPNRWSRDRRRRPRSSRRSYPTASAPWFRRTSTSVRASWCRPKTAPTWNGRRTSRRITATPITREISPMC